MNIFYLLARIINLLANLIVLLIVVDTVVGYFLSPYHPLCQTLDRLVAPLLAPIRRIIPPVGMFDFSPLILIILVEVVSYALTSLLNAL
jgi:YggT family protein